MTKKIFAFLISAAAVCLISGCTNSGEISNAPVSGTSSTSQNSDKEEISSNSDKKAFGLDEFNELCKINIDGKEIVFPCNAGELKPEFYLGGKPVIQDDFKLATFALMRDDTGIGTCTVRYDSGIDISNAVNNTDELNDCILTGISFSPNKISDLTCGWVSFKTKPEELLSCLGESERFDFGDGIYILNFSVNYDKTANRLVEFVIDGSNKICDIGFCCE